MSVIDRAIEFLEHLKDDQEMLDGQFNPFIREHSENAAPATHSQNI
ncbi:MAG: hypothetical protein KAW09_00010 [Thermoplasmata archaeon]|nr:hypothetical protein [Thermoplasmata archaeon]